MSCFCVKRDGWLIEMVPGQRDIGVMSAHAQLQIHTHKPPPRPSHHHHSIRIHYHNQAHLGGPELVVVRLEQEDHLLELLEGGLFAPLRRRARDEAPPLRTPLLALRLQQVADLLCACVSAACKVGSWDRCSGHTHVCTPIYLSEHTDKLTSTRSPTRACSNNCSCANCSAVMGLGRVVKPVIRSIGSAASPTPPKIYV